MMDIQEDRMVEGALGRSLVTKRVMKMNHKDVFPHHSKAVEGSDSIPWLAHNAQSNLLLNV